MYYVMYLLLLSRGKLSAKIMERLTDLPSHTVDKLDGSPPSLSQKATDTNYAHDYASGSTIEEHDHDHDLLNTKRLAPQGVFGYRSSYSKLALTIAVCYGGRLHARCSGCGSLCLPGRISTRLGCSPLSVLSRCRRDHLIQCLIETVSSLI
ncbi:hypothetical protein PILCRDRAFT_375957 [Piloderma croceum F 1598]|uniref:Uncharacterized protein n=1 Tax=Piloderma croceum (strain F 1598) TaxID=765440 RepID=A0A0C3G2P5_PILCF|nr:hypothetical protein PILCRDRAFT_375957 [Piloderma croceum F 1598]